MNFNEKSSKVQNKLASECWTLYSWTIIKSKTSFQVKKMRERKKLHVCGGVGKEISDPNI